MKKLNVLLVCGSGASSGFMAANMRKAASKAKADESPAVENASAEAPVEEKPKRGRKSKKSEETPES